jgi:hypothetical protein
MSIRCVPIHGQEKPLSELCDNKMMAFQFQVGRNFLKQYTNNNVTQQVSITILNVELQ